MSRYIGQDISGYRVIEVIGASAGSNGILTRKGQQEIAGLKPGNNLPRNSHFK